MTTPASPGGQERCDQPFFEKLILGHLEPEWHLSSGASCGTPILTNDTNSIV